MPNLCTDRQTPKSRQLFYWLGAETSINTCNEDPVDAFYKMQHNNIMTQWKLEKKMCIHPHSYCPPNCDVRNSVHTLFGKCWSAWTGGRLWAPHHLKVSHIIFCCFATGRLYYQCFLVCEESFGVNGECCLVSQWKVEVALVVEEAAAASGSAPVAVLSLQGSPLPYTHRRNSVTKRTQIHTHSRHSPSPFLKHIPVLSATSRFSLKMFSRLNRNVRSSFQSIYGWSLEF